MPTTTTQRHVHVEPVMGTVVSFDVRDRVGDVDVDAAVRSAVAWLHEVDIVFSTYRPDSVVSRIDRRELVPAEAPADVRWILARCEQLRRETGGAFDVLATGRLDPSALVKGWAVEGAVHLLEAAGLSEFCITAGGDVACRGAASPATPWRVGIQHPLDPDAIAAVVELRGEAVATSGTYERGLHIVTPPTGLAPTGVLSTTVIGPDLGTADAYSTAAFAMGERGPAWTAELPARGYEAMTILADHTVQTTAGFPLVDARRAA
jgi:thiamine biosynthesis lipoprotein